jgi:serine/threonine protein kinase
MGEVYLAAHRGPSGFAKLVVLKILRSELTSDDEMMTMFADEARLSAQLSHPNIAQTLELVVDAEQPFLVLEYLDGQPLSAILRKLAKRGQRIPVRVIVKIIIDILHALEYAHGATALSGAPLQVVHRDVSPQNIFVTYAGQGKLLDFGIAKPMLRTEATKAGVLKGKIRFMAPEQATGMDVDHRADLFSLGLVLLHGISGKRPWEDANDSHILLALATRKVPSAREMLAANNQLPQALVQICNRALAVDREARYPTAREMRADLEAFLATTDSAGEPEDAGAFIDELFSTERTEKRSLVETKLKELMETPTASSMTLPTRTEMLRRSRIPMIATVAFPVLIVCAVIGLVVSGQQRRSATNAMAAPPPAASTILPAPAAQPRTEVEPPAPVAAATPVTTPATSPAARASAPAPPAKPVPTRSAVVSAPKRASATPVRGSNDVFDLGPQE